MNPRCFQIRAEDNVAVLIDDADAGVVDVLGATRTELVTQEKINVGHKIAVRDIAPGEAILKYGARIGHATKAIARGAWVHLHNLASDMDARSNTLDVHSGAPTDTRYE